MLEGMDIKKSASDTIFKRLVWHTARRDQAGIAEELANEQEVHEIYGLGDASLFDEFFSFLRQLGIMKVLEQLAPRRHRKRESSVCFSTGMLIYFMRIVTGLKFFYHAGPVFIAITKMFVFFEQRIPPWRLALRKFTRSEKFERRIPPWGYT
jgi:hypothetical protein